MPDSSLMAGSIVRETPCISTIGRPMTRCAT